MVFTLRCACRSGGWQLSPNGKLWFLGTNGGTHCDFYIVTAHHLYAVKLFAVKSRASTLVFLERRRYLVRRYLALIGNTGTSARIPVESAAKRLPQYHFRYRMRPEWEPLLQHHILLINPICHEITDMPMHGKEVLRGISDRVYDMQLYSVSRLITRIQADQSIRTL